MGNYAGDPHVLEGVIIEFGQCLTRFIASVPFCHDHSRDDKGVRYGRVQPMTFGRKC